MYSLRSPCAQFTLVQVFPVSAASLGAAAKKLTIPFGLWCQWE